MQFYSPANATHGNVVRVAPRQKNATTTATAPATQHQTTMNSTSSSQPASTTYHCYNLAHSFPSTNPNSIAATSNLSTYPNFLQINNSLNSSGGKAIAAGATTNQHHQMPISAQCNGDHNDSIKSSFSTSSTLQMNPFLAKRPKSVNHTVKRSLTRPTQLKPASPPPPPPPPSLHQLQQLQQQQHHQQFSTLSMPRSGQIDTTIAAKSIAMHCAMADKKFNSLKAMHARKTPQFYSLRLNKCRRHQAHTNPNICGAAAAAAAAATAVQQKLLVINNSSMNPYLQTKLHHSDSEQDTGGGGGGSSASTSMLRKKFNHQHQQPLYENLVNASLEHAENGGILAAPHTVNAEEFFSDANDANSIYRSDSGISNSSYELTPVPAPRNNPRNCQSAPVYMNLPKYASVCGTNSKYRIDNGGSSIIVTPNTKIGFATAFNYEVCVCVQDYATNIFPIKFKWLK